DSAYPRIGYGDGAAPATHLHHVLALVRFPFGRIREEPPLIVAVDDVHLERDRLLSAVDDLEPRRVVLSRVFQQPDGVALSQRRAGGARKSLVRQLAQRREAEGFRRGTHSPDIHYRRLS